MRKSPGRLLRKNPGTLIMKSEDNEYEHGGRLV